jgi:hypothetical protein
MSVAHVVLAYRRPNLLRSFVARWQDIAEGRKLIISVDGLNETANHTERDQHAEVVRVARGLESSVTGLRVIIQPKNVFSTHFAEVCDAVEASCSSFVAYEEDLYLLPGAIDFLEMSVRGKKSPAHGAAYSHFMHRLPPSLTRETMFPAQWGLAVNRAMLDEFWQTKHQGRVDPEVVRQRIGEMSGLSMASRERRVRRWTKRFTDAFAIGHFDGVMQYSLWRLGIRSVAPWAALVKDRGHEELGGYSARPTDGVRVKGRHLAPQLPRVLQAAGTGVVCNRCERLNS